MPAQSPRSQRNLLKLAVALKYEYQQDVSPLVVATGKGELAEALLKKAQDLGIPIQEDKPLAEALSSLPPGTPVPEDFYQVVAQILAMVYRLEGRQNEPPQGSPYKAG
jgi:flagellar biosynthesis protein